MQSAYVEAEMNVLASAMIDSNTLHDVIPVVEVNDFTIQSHKIIYKNIIELFEKGSPIDLITVANKVNSSVDVSYLAQLVDSIPSSAKASHYAQIIKQNSIRRSLIEASNQIIELSQGDFEDSIDCVEKAENLISKISNKAINATQFDLKTLVSAVSDAIVNVNEDTKKKHGISTGFRTLDKLTAGFHKSDLVIIAARPAMGKTAFALNIINHSCIVQKKPTLLFSLEMSKEQLIQRLICGMSFVDASLVRNGARLSEEEQDRIIASSHSIAESPLFIDESSSISVSEIRAKAKKIQREHGLEMIVIDYLQLMKGNNSQSREREIAEISRALKAIAKDLNVPVVALSQLNRALETRVEKRPQLSDLRESGAIEQDADLILFLYREEVYTKSTEDKCIAEIIIGKQRSGPIGTAKVAFINKFTRFFDIITKQD